MKDDFSNIETGSSCYVLNNATTIYSYKNSTRTTYVQVGGKWYKNSTQVYTNIPTNTVCWTYSDITSLNSKAEYYPIFAFIAIILAFVVWFVCFRLLCRLVRFKP